jgi:hypothetical protein
MENYEKKIKQGLMESMFYREHWVFFFLFWWNKAFLDGRECVKDEPRSGRPCTSNDGRNCDQSEGSRDV